jgi:hypothetical protein
MVDQIHAGEPWNLPRRGDGSCLTVGPTAPRHVLLVHQVLQHLRRIRIYAQQREAAALVRPGKPSLPRIASLAVWAPVAKEIEQNNLPPVHAQPELLARSIDALNISAKAFRFDSDRSVRS